MGLGSWDVTKATVMTATFTSATSITSCSKRQIADAWAGSDAFTATAYDDAWTDDTCVAAQLSDADFKQASWGT